MFLNNSVILFCVQIIPIESSMENNRPRFKLYLHMAVCQVSMILGSFGLLGYLIYGSNVPQIVTDTLPPTVFSQAIRVTLIIAVLFTYPLQLFPVIEIFEDLFFTRVVSNSKSHLSEIIAGPSASLVSRRESDRNRANYQTINEAGPSLDESVLSKGMSTESLSTRASVAESEVLLQQPSELEASGVQYKVRSRVAVRSCHAQANLVISRMQTTNDFRSDSRIPRNFDLFLSYQHILYRTTYF